MDSGTTSTPRRQLPIGIQSFAKLRQDGCYYMDKTGLAIDLIESGSYFFLSRSRRFGKSLLIDTFQDLFEGHWALFDELAAALRWDWARQRRIWWNLTWRSWLDDTESVARLLK